MPMVEADAAIVDIRAGDDIASSRSKRMLGNVRPRHSGMTISNGSAPSGEGSDGGGHLCQQERQRLDVADSTVTGNSSSNDRVVGLYARICHP